MFGDPNTPPPPHASLHLLVQQHPVEQLQLDSVQDVEDVDTVGLTQRAHRTILNHLQYKQTRDLLSWALGS